MKISHLRAAKGNAGDIVIPDAVMKELETILPIEDLTWHPMNIRKRNWTQDNVDYVNTCDMAVLGGGGLFLHDTVKDSASDWQWDISTELLKNVRGPLVVYAVGFNLFRGHREFKSVFKDSVNELIRKSVYFSLRHRGGIEKLKAYADPELHDKITFHFCPTLTFAPITMEEKQKYVKKKTVGVLVAGDRPHLRHKDLDTYISHISKVLEFLKKDGYKTYCIVHMVGDERIHGLLGKHFDDHIVLGGTNNDFIYNVYKQMDFIIGDRGHSQLIPFSVGCKTIVPISHDKLKWFFEDVDMSEYGIEEDDPDLSEKIITLVKDFDEEKWNEQHKKAMNLIKTTNQNNLELIKERLKECPNLSL